LKLFDCIFRVPFFRPEFGVDIAGLPVKELVAILGGDLPCVLGRVDSQLAEEGERVRDVDLRYILPVSVDVLDKGVGDPVPGELLTSGSSKQRMVTKMGGCVDHRHCRLVPVNVVPFTERVQNVQLDVGEGGERVEDEGGQVLHALDVLPHERDALPVVHHVLVQVRLYGGRISVHVPQLISAVDDESFTVKVLRTRAIQSGTFPQAGVVVTSGHLACYFAIGD